MSKGGQYFERHQKVFPLDLRYLIKELGCFFWGGVTFGVYCHVGTQSHSQYS